MSYPIQRQSDSYGVFDNGDMRFAKEYTNRDLPEGLVNMLAGPRISAGLNNPRAAHFENEYGRPGPLNPPSYYAEDSPEALNEPREPWEGEPPAHGPGGYPIDEHALREELRPDATGGAGFPAGGHGPYDFAEEAGPPVPHHDYLAQFRPHIASFTEARHLTADDGPAPGPGLFSPMLFQPKAPILDSMLLGGGDGSSEKAFVGDHPANKSVGEWVTAAAVQPQVVPGWIGHGYAAGHRVGLPWRDQLIPGTVTHLDGQQVGVRWDDGQHSSEEPSDLRPL